MPENNYEGQTKAWLLERRTALQELTASGSGSPTHVGIAQGIFHEFKEMSRKELLQTLRDVRYALWCLEPGTYPNPYAQRVMKVFMEHSC